MLLDVRQGLLLIYGIPNFKVQCNHIYVSYIPFEVPCKSTTQNADKKGFKIGMHLEITEKNN